MSHSVFFGTQVALIVLVGRHFNGHVFYDFQSVGFQSHTFHRVVGEQTHLVDADFAKNLCTYSVVTFVGLVSQAKVGIYCVHSFFLQLVGFHLFHEADAASFLVQVDDGSLSFFFDLLHGFVQLFAAVAAHGTEDVAGSAR